MIIWPADGKITQKFGENPDFYSKYRLAGHEGIDVGVPVGTPLKAPNSGKVITGESTGYGSYVLIRAREFETWVAHLSEIQVWDGEEIDQGDIIGLSGVTGRSTGPHYHLSFRPLPHDKDNGYKGCVDPLPRLQENVTVGSKLGIHTQTEPERGQDTLADIIADSPIEAIKAINPTSWPEPLTTMFPNVKRGYARFWIGGDHKEHDLMRQGARGAEEYYDMLADRYERALEMGWEYFTAPNEPHPTLWDNPASANEFWLKWVGLVSKMGAIPYIGQFGNGWPAEGAISIYSESIAAATDAGGGVEAHEYGFPTVRSDEPDMFGRHQQWMADLAEMDIYPPVIIGEFGITRAVHGGPDTGWKSMGSWVYPPMFGLPQQTMDHELWWRMVSDADDEYCRFDYIVDIFPFISWPQSDWSTFDWGEWHIRRQIKKKESSVMPSPVDPAEPTIPEPEDSLNNKIRRACWNSVGVGYNKDAALQRFAAKRWYGAPQTPEIEVGDYIVQGFPLAILKVKKGDWENVEEISWGQL